MRIVIIEDEQLTANDLGATIKSVEPQSEIAALLGSVKESVAWFDAGNTCDLIFCDIQLGDGLSFEIFSKINISAPVIFCTAFDEYAINAFKTNGIDYILKPFSAESVHTAIGKYYQLKQNFTNESGIQLEKILKNLMTGSSQSSANLLINYKDKILPVKIFEIALFFVENEITHLLTFDSKVFTINKTLEELEQVCGKGFFRVNRQCLINRKAVVDVTRFFSRKLLVNITVPFEEIITVSKEKTPQFLAWLESTM